MTRVAVAGERGTRRGAVPARGIAACFGALALALATALVAGCARHTAEPDAAAKQDSTQQARAQQLVDAGNQAYQQGDYRLAARRYAAAAVVKRDDPAAYFGMGMALSKLGRDEEARAAYARSRELTRTRAALDGASPHRRSSGPADTIRTHP